MPSDAENTMFLYLVLTHENKPVIDWNAVGTAMNLNKGAVSKRWSRLKQAMDKGGDPSGSTYEFLWLCVKHSNRAGAPNWDAIAGLAGTTSGAASKRYSRMKAAFDSGADASETPAKTAKTPKSTAKTGQTGKTLDSDTAPNSMPSKRKRATAKFSIVKSETGDEEENSDDLPTTPSKKARKMPVKSKVTPKPKVKPEVRDASIEEEVAGDTTPPTSASTTPEVKDEPVENEEVFFDAEDGGAGLVDENVDQV